MKADEIKKGDTSAEPSRFSISKIKDGLRDLAQIKVEDLAKVSNEVLHGNIEDMLSAIRVLEAQLKDTMEVNVAMRIEAKTRDSEIFNLKRENQDLQYKLKELEKQNPMLGEVDRRLEMALERVDEHKAQLDQEKEKTRALAAQNEEFSKALKKAEEERDDAYKEVVVLMDKFEQKESVHG
ncbi:hypothetical protein WDW86_20390 [Bdellovibrionota bacterium FG-2]